ncbi:MAG: hypothetical protein UY36_C0002G0025 [Parcubacteria group bacterium GW2011_GWA1_49_11]|nr:MAG: hypothetical protein UY36_C0002G0025 [Parcubacteria group bacterium GW2011_GWA1_49_11]
MDPPFIAKLLSLKMAERFSMLLKESSPAKLAVLLRYIGWKRVILHSLEKRINRVFLFCGVNRRLRLLDGVSLYDPDKRAEGAVTPR